MKAIDRVRKGYNHCWDIFQEHGGYEFNDEMLYQLQGLQQSIDECEDEDDYEHMMDEVIKTKAWFDWVVKMILLKEAEPESLYC